MPLSCLELKGQEGQGYGLYPVDLHPAAIAV